MEEMCRAALTLGLPEIGFTEHYDLLPDDPCYAFFRADAWWEELERCRSQFSGDLRIRAGIELGEPHRFAEDMESLLSTFEWDYSLGSLHWVGDELIFDHNYFRRSPDLAYREYFLELAQMAALGGFDVLAHMDVVKRYGFNAYGFYDPLSFEPEIRKVLRACVSGGIALEVNTAMLRRPVNQTSPVRPILDWYREEGGQWITFGSDAHHPDHIGYGLHEVVSAVRGAGFENMASFTGRNPEAVPIRGDSPSPLPLA